VGPSRARRLWTAFVALFVLASIGSAVLRYEKRIARFVNYKIQREQYRSGDDPLLRGLATGEYGPGYPVEELIRMYPPKCIYRHDEFVTATFGKPGEFGGTEVIAMNGKVVFARDDVWRSPSHVFFRNMSPAEGQAYSQSFSALIDAIIEKRNALSMAVAGAAAVAYMRGEYDPAPNP
jgi:hypothetical protein